MARHGSCHCVAFAVAGELPGEAMACNCSPCRRKGVLLTFIPADSFTRDRGEDALSTYFFHKHRIRHRFCRHCGVQTFAEGEMNGQPIRAVNLRAVPECDPDALIVTQVNGAEFQGGSTFGG